MMIILYFTTTYPIFVFPVDELRYDFGIVVLQLEAQSFFFLEPPHFAHGLADGFGTSTLTCLTIGGITGGNI